jgi:hypothetical protein
VHRLKCGNPKAIKYGAIEVDQVGVMDLAGFAINPFAAGKLTHSFSPLRCHKQPRMVSPYFWDGDVERADQRFFPIFLKLEA